MAADLAEVLLSPVAADLGAYERLVFVLDGALHWVPLGALPRPDGQGRPLIADFDVVQAPSLSVIAGLRERRESASRGMSAPGDPSLRSATASIVVLADPVFERQDPRLNQQSNPDEGVATTESSMLRREGLRRLPASGDEARAIAALAPDVSTVYTGFDASRQAVLNGALKDAHIVHFATHGQVDTLQPRLSGLSLAAWDELAQPVDGHLSLQEIYGLSMPETQLVVLSGCRTAFGNEQRGEGLLSLTRGFSPCRSLPSGGQSVDGGGRRWAAFDGNLLPSALA